MIIINLKLGDKVICSNTDTKLDEYRVILNESGQNNESAKTSDDSSTSSPCTWQFYEYKKNDELYKIGYRVKLIHQKPIENIASKILHPKGDYFALVLDAKNSNSSVTMHQMSRQKSVRPNFNVMLKFMI